MPVAAGLAAGAFPGLITGGIASAPMEIWPLGLFPNLLVPLFIIAHLIVLIELRDQRRTKRTVPRAAALAGQIA